jgi:hypothetical protein
VNQVSIGFGIFAVFAGIVMYAARFYGAYCGYTVLGVCIQEVYPFYNLLLYGGIFLGFIGFISILIGMVQTGKCPYCGYFIRNNRRVCPKCGKLI